MLLFLIANPPVPAVPKEVNILSNSGIPPIHNNTISNTVNKRYIPYNHFAVLFSLGTNLLVKGPGTSAFTMCIEFSLDIGSIAIAKTSIPIPPIQWVKLLQNNRPFGSASTSLKIDEPVVVKPETVSKNASTYEGICPDKKNGNAPKTDNEIHDR